MKAKETTGILRALRALMAGHGDVSGRPVLAAYLVPTEDAHQSEYISERDSRREFITGFTGSSGIAVVTQQHAALWTDGRYHLQASLEIDANWTLMKDGLATTPRMDEWLLSTLPSNSVVGVDPLLISAPQYRKIHKQLASWGHQLVPVQDNLVDMVWGAQQPPFPSGPITCLPTEYTGKSTKDKLHEVRTTMAKKKASTLVLSALDEIAWLFNLRGSDIAFNPVFLSYALVTQDDAVLYVDRERLACDPLQHFGCHVTFHPYNGFLQDIATRFPTLVTQGLVWVGPKCSQAIAALLQEDQMIGDDTPVTTAKAVKNSTELQGMRSCHVRDAVALTEFFSWMEAQFRENPARKDITEIVAADKLEACRREQKDFVSLSFPTISSAGPNGAIIHYRPTPDSCAVVTTNAIYLCDSGAQYRDGTTDVTRTVHFGQPRSEEKECFTHVLKGHIALDRSVFPNGTTGRSLDAFARQSLWSAGLDYCHGTGHGVGAFLNVHEGPIGISGREGAAKAPLQEGMIVTNEPGFYQDGAFGIRIENVVEVVKAATKHNFQNWGFLAFNPITLFPIQARMIDIDLLTEQEVEWMDAYHQRVLQTVGKELSAQGRTDALAWLELNTRPIREMVADY